MNRYYKKTICSNDCTASCALIVETDGKRIYSVKGDPDHPLYKGMTCGRMMKHHEAIHDENRIIHPLKRIGNKGEGLFKEVSWDEAIKDITDHFKSIIKEYGPESIVPLISAGNMGAIQMNIPYAFFNKMNAANIVGTVCNGSKSAGNNSVTGGAGSKSPYDVINTDFMLIWGSNFKATLPHSIPIINSLRKKGVRVVIVDVCAIDTYQYADELILIKPGSDSALALSMMHVLKNEGYIDYDFLEKYAVGYNEFIDTLDQYTPAWASKICGIKEETIIELAREYGNAKAPTLLHGNGNTRRKAGGMNARIIAILSFITGSWLTEGGYIGRSVKSGPCIKGNLISRPDLRTIKHPPENMNLLSQILNEREIKCRALYVSGSNPVNSFSDQVGIIKGLKREDLFTVVHERNMTDTAKYADYILPATFAVEHTDCFTAVYHPVFNTSYKVIDAPGTCKSNRETISLLAKEMGYTDDIFNMNDEELLEMLLDNAVYPLTELSDEQKEVLRVGGSVELPRVEELKINTPSGKLQMVDERQDYPIPCFINDMEEGLCLIAIPSVYSVNSVFNFRKDLMDKRGEMVIYINPMDAISRNLKDGELVEVYNDLASVPYKLKVSDKVSVGSACVIGIYDSNHSKQLLQFNALNHSVLADLGGSTLNGNYVEIKTK